MLGKFVSEIFKLLKCQLCLSTTVMLFVLLCLQYIMTLHLHFSVVSHCNEEYFARTEPANITSPGYPNEYPNNVDSCITTILANEGQHVMLEFEEFDIEEDSRCRYDYLEVIIILFHCTTQLISSS